MRLYGFWVEPVGPLRPFSRLKKKQNSTEFLFETGSTGSTGQPKTWITNF
jgi:hypothetical protein